jgi:glycerophosphoryl diester phosphodiesterase
MEDLIKITQRKVEQRQMLSLVLDARGKTGEKLFRVVDNTVAVRRQLGAGEVMIKSFDDEFPTLLKNLSEGSQRELKNILSSMGYGQNSAIVMHKNARDILKRVEKAYVDLPQFVKTYDKFLNTWKGLTLITPGFHMRNLFGNSFNSYAVGMDLAAQSRYATTALKELDQFTKIGKKLAEGVKLTAAEERIYKLVSGFYESGVAQTHRGIRDLEQIKEAVEAATKGGKLKTGYNNLIRLNFNFAEKMDDFQRYMLYRWALDKTGDSVKASRTVAESLFDYHHLTNFEKDYMKRLFPFYTFMKNNFVFQAKNIFNNPKAYARIGRTYKYGLEDLAGYGPDDMPDYATENMWIPIPMTVDKNDKEAIAFLKANLPLSDFTELVENPFRKGATSLTAPVKLLIEFGVGRDLFTGAPISEFPGQTNAMEAGTGVLSRLRDSRGNLTLTQSPIAQKIMADLGFRTPMNIGGVGLDVLDTMMGYQGRQEGFGDFMARMGLIGVQEKERLEITTLYQELEQLRELKKYYEQQTGNQLPVLPR